MRRRNVRAFINADPVSIEITREGAPIKTDAGGYKQGVATTLSPQLARIVPNRRRYTDGLVNAEAGDIPKTDYLLIGNHTLNLEAGDMFKWLGENYKVTGIHLQRQESVLAAIELQGPDNRGS